MKRFLNARPQRRQKTAARKSMSANVANPATTSRFEIEALELRTLLTSLGSLVDTPNFDAQISPLVPAGSARLEFNAASPIVVDAFIDFDANGVFSAAERVSAPNGFNADAGPSQLVFDVPADAASQTVGAQIEWTLGNAVSVVSLSSVDIQVAPNGQTSQGVVADAAYSGVAGDTIDGGILGVSRFASLQQAIDVVAEGGIVTAAPGLFSESITIEKDLTVQGSDQNAALTMLTPGDLVENGIEIANGANVSLANVTVSGANTGIQSKSGGSLTLNNVVSTSNLNHGLQVITAGDVLILNSAFSQNDSDQDGTGRGIQLLNVGNVTLNQVVAASNDLGLSIGNAQSVSDTNGEYSENDDHGIFLSDIIGDVAFVGTQLMNNDANFDNKGDGLVVEDTNLEHGVGGSLSFLGVSIGTSNGGNQRDGVTVESVAGNVSFGSSTTVFGNNSDGVTLGTIAGAVQIADSKFSGTKGIDRQGSNFFVLRATDVIVANSVFTDAGNKDGLQIETSTGTINISNSTFDSNNRYGLRVDRSSVVELDNNTFENNGSDGIRMSNNFGGLQLTDISADNNGGDGLRLYRAGDTIINGGEFSGMLVRQANSFTLNPATDGHSKVVTSTDRIDVESKNAVTFNANVDATDSTVRISANSNGNGAEGFHMAAGTSLVTSSDSPTAVSIMVNSILGGTGNADLQEIVTGTNQGTIGVYTNRGQVVDANGTASNLTSGNAVIHAMSAVGSSTNVLNGTVNRLEGSGNGFYFLNSQPLTIGGVDPGFTGISSPNEGIDVRSLGAMNVNENVVGVNHVFLKALETNDQGDDLTANFGVRIQSINENLEIRAGDDIKLQFGSTISAAGTITIKADCAENDPGVGSTVQIASHVFSGAGTTVEAGADDDVFEITYPSTSKHKGGVTILESTGTDALIITGTESDDTLFVTPKDDDIVVARDNIDSETIFVPSTVETLKVRTLEGLDTVSVAAGTKTEVSLDGGSPTFGEPGVPAGDTIKFAPSGHVFSMVNSSLEINNAPDIPFRNFETIELANASTGPAQKFDFGTLFSSPTTSTTGFSNTPIQEGYEHVLDTTRSSVDGFGWDNQVGRTHSSVASHTGLLSNLNNDAHTFRFRSGAETRTFSTPVENGLLLVTVNYGSESNNVTEFQIENRDTNQTLVKGLQARRGSWGHQSFFVEVTDGSLDLRFRAPFGKTRLIVLNGLSIEPAKLLGMGIAPPSNALPADGTTIDEFAFAGLPNKLVTVSTTLGKIASEDVDKFLLGTQILTDNEGQAKLQVQRANVEGTASLTFSMPTGELLSGAEIEYATVNSRNFDFNDGGTATFSPFDSSSNPDGYVGVAPNTRFSNTLGYGWTSSAPTGHRLKSTVPAQMADLYYDGHLASAASTFRTLLSNGRYQVSVLSGSRTDHTNFQIVANGRLMATAEYFAAQEFYETVFDVEVSNGTLDLTFSQFVEGFQDPNWTVNGLSIRPQTMVSGFTQTTNVGNVLADGVTLSRLTFDSTAPEGTLVSVSTSAGTITTLDEDPVTVGTQIAVKGGQVAFDLQAADQPGTPVIDLHTIKGDHRSTIGDEIFLDFLDAFFSNSVSETTPFE